MVETPHKSWWKLQVSSNYEREDRWISANYRAIPLLFIPGQMCKQRFVDQMKQ